jgi:hypothetical protein
MSPVTPQEDFRTIMLNRVSWAAVLAGVVVSLVTQLLLNMLGLGLGLSTLDPGTGTTPRQAPSRSARRCGGQSPASSPPFRRLRGRPSLRDAQGIDHRLAWDHRLGAHDLLIFYLLTTTVGAVLGGAFNAIGNAASGLTQTAATAAVRHSRSRSFSEIEQQVRPRPAVRIPPRSGTPRSQPCAAAVTGDQAQAQEAQARPHRLWPPLKGSPLRRRTRRFRPIRSSISRRSTGCSSSDGSGQYDGRRGVHRRAVRVRRARAGRDRGVVRRPLRHGGADDPAFRSRISERASELHRMKEAGCPASLLCFAVDLLASISSRTASAQRPAGSRRVPIPRHLQAHLVRHCGDHFHQLRHLVLGQQADLQVKIGALVGGGRNSILADQHEVERKIASTEAIMASTTNEGSHG